MISFQYQEADLPKVVKAIFEQFPQATIFSLSGEIGAGKTTFVKQFCAFLGSKDEVTSPTFSIVNEYHYPKEKGIGVIYHMDLYRLQNIEEALNIGIEEYLDQGDFCLIEWPELIEEVVLNDFIRINIEILPDSGRKIIIL